MHRFFFDMYQMLYSLYEMNVIDDKIMIYNRDADGEFLTMGKNQKSNDLMVAK
jgi:hypothetical protein